MGQESIYEGSGAIPRARVHDETRRLVDDQQVLIFVKNRQGDGLALPGDFRLERGHEVQTRPAADALARAHGRPVEA